MLNAMRPMAAREGFTQRVTVREMMTRMHPTSTACSTPAPPSVRCAMSMATSTSCARSCSISLAGGQENPSGPTSRTSTWPSWNASWRYRCCPTCARTSKPSCATCTRSRIAWHSWTKSDLQERRQFTAEIRLDEVMRHDKKVVRNALNAGATMEAVSAPTTATISSAATSTRRLPAFAHTFWFRWGGRPGDRARPAAVRRTGCRLRQAPHSACRRRLPAALANQAAHASAGRRGPARPSDAEISEAIWTELLRAIGLTLPLPRACSQLVREQAAAACRALDQLAQGNHRLSVYLKELQEAKAMPLAQK